jgi:membrane associated rhomboid family serine protease
VGSQVSAALIIFVATIAISLIGLFGAPKLIDRSLFRPYWFLRRKQYDTVIMSGFVHADLMHLIFNMMTFYFFAFPLERDIGTTQFVLLYLAGLLISHAGTYYKQRNNPEYACLGASGAISAVLFAAIVYRPDQSLRCSRCCISRTPITRPGIRTAASITMHTWAVPSRGWRSSR